MEVSLQLPWTRAALVVAHPGHELRVHGWLQQVRPLVCVMTDGSGRSGCSRVAATRRLLSEVGARPGGIYGRWTDARVYEALLGGEFAFFTAIAEELAATLVTEQIQYVATDAAEGYNPTHDI